MRVLDLHCLIRILATSCCGEVNVLKDQNLTDLRHYFCLHLSSITGIICNLHSNYTVDLTCGFSCNTGLCKTDPAWHLKHVFMLFCVVCRSLINAVPPPVGLSVCLLHNIKLGRLDLASHTDSFKRSCCKHSIAV